MRLCFKALLVPLLLLLLQWFKVTDAKFPGSLKDLEYDVYPRRTQEEAAVLEWGHSAIISALDASVAHFGPQTSQAALLEVETHPVLAVPLNGVFDKTHTNNNNNNNALTDSIVDSKIRPLLNHEEVTGNMVVMTNTGDLSGLQMAKIAKASGAAALLVVNVEEDRPDDIYRLPADEEGADKIDFPVVMISLNSANVLTTATVAQGMEQTNIVNHGMPERVRLYAGGDRPFFEDIEPNDPTLYLIHNLLTNAECDSLVRRAESRVERLPDIDDILQLSVEVEKYFNVQRVMLWQGLLQTPGLKQIEERIEQVSGFPANHYSDFVIDRLEAGSYWEPHYDTNPNQIPMATITVFLTSGGGQIIYPAGKDKPLKILPQKGMAVVHHNLNERQELDRFSRHAMLPPETGPVFVARKYIFATQVSMARRIALPLFALPFGGKLPRIVVRIHDALIYRYGLAYGALYFDKLCLFFPALILLGIVQVIGSAIRDWLNTRGKAAAASKDKSNELTKENSKKKVKQNGKTEKESEKNDSKKTKESDSKKTKDNDGKKAKENDSKKGKENDSKKNKESESKKGKESDAKKTKESDSKKAKESDAKKTKESDSKKAKESEPTKENKKSDKEKENGKANNKTETAVNDDKSKKSSDKKGKQNGKHKKSPKSG